MLFLPVAERELRIRSRLTATYRQRTVAVVIALMLLVGMSVVFGFHRSPADVGKTIFNTFAVLTALLCLFEGARNTADCLSEEAREGTLGLLFLADLGPLDVVLGKLASASLSSLYGLLAIFPVAAIPLLMGGVTGGEVWRLTLALVNALWFSLMAGLWVSSLSRDQIKAALGSAALILIASVGPWVADDISRLGGGPPGMLHWLSPFTLCLLALEQNYSVAPGMFWPCLGWAHLAAWLLLALTCFNMRQGWRDTAVAPKRTHRVFEWLWEKLAGYETAQRRSRAMKELLVINPVEWLGMHRHQHSAYLWMTVVIVGGCVVWMSRYYLGRGFSGWLWGFILGFNIFLKIWAAIAACHAMSAARRDGSLELLVATPLNVRKIVAGHFGSLQRQFRGPVIFWTIMVFAAPVVAVSKDISSIVEAVIVLAGFGIVQAIFILDLYAMGWVGLWFGFSRATMNRAALRTVLLVQGLPLMLVFVPFFGVIFMLHMPFWGLFLIFWAQGRLHNEFRRMLTEPARTKPNDSWVPAFLKSTPAKPPRLMPLG